MLPAEGTQVRHFSGEDERILATLDKDACKTYEESMLEIYRRLRPGEPPTVEAAETLMNNLFFDPRRYDLSVVGRYKFNKKLALWVRAAERRLAAPVVHPATGEVLYEEGHLLTRNEARELDAIVASTASPFKFCSSVLEALGEADIAQGLDALDQLTAKTGQPAPAPLAGLRDKAVRFTGVVEKDRMVDAVLSLLE